MSDIVLKLQNLTKIYSRSHLGRTTKSTGIQDLNLEIKKGEVFGLLGLNGSGKTTTIKLILGLLFPTQGDIHIFDQKMPHSLAQKKVGYLPEVPYFYRNLSPTEVLELYASLSKLSSKSIPDRINEVLRMVSMSHAAHKPMREFSKGMLQRIGLAQSLIHDPDFLVFDEPVTGLDPLGIRQIRLLLLDLKKQGKTIFFSSHSISELERLADRVGVLVDGRMVRTLTNSDWKDHAGKLEELFIQTLESSGTSLVR